MRFLSIYKTVERPAPPSQEEMDRMGRYIEASIKQGVLISTEGCLPSALGARVRRTDGRVTVTHGPFTETKEVVGGFAILEAKSKAHALELAQEFLAFVGEGECEIRQLYEAPAAVRIETPQITHSVAQSAAVLHLTIPRSEIRTVMGPGYREVMDAVKAQGLTPAGPWFTHHLRWDPDTFDFEIGIPVTKPFAAAGRVQPGQLPATRVARTVYRGSYDRLGDAWGEFMGWIETAGHTPGADFWEVYSVGPEINPDPTTWRTELNRPVA